MDCGDTPMCQLCWRAMAHSWWNCVPQRTEPRHVCDCPEGPLLSSRPGLLLNSLWYPAQRHSDLQGFTTLTVALRLANPFVSCRLGQLCRKKKKKNFYLDWYCFSLDFRSADFDLWALKSMFLWFIIGTGPQSFKHVDSGALETCQHSCASVQDRRVMWLVGYRVAKNYFNFSKCSSF